VFLRHIRNLPKEEVKVLIGDNLAAHLSPVVTELCEENNVRFIFLPENSTHLLQPLDVAVFGPMKRKWKEVLTAWKEECARKGTNYATIPKQVIKKKKKYSTCPNNHSVRNTVPYRYKPMGHGTRYGTTSSTNSEIQVVQFEKVGSLDILLTVWPSTSSIP
jgi:hypothetical protein